MKSRLPPGPPSPALLGALPGALWGATYLAAGERLLERAMEYYGPAMYVRLPGLGRVVLVKDPALVRQIFTAPTDVLLGGAGVGPSAPIYGDRSMFVLEEPEHLRRRKLLTPPLHGKALASYAPLIAQRTAAALPLLAADEGTTVLAWARSLTLEVITEVMFGVSDAEELHRLGKPFEALLDLAVSEELTLRYMFRGAGAISRWSARDAAWRAIDEAVYPLIQERRADGGAERTDILSLLMSTASADGDGLTDREIRDDLITLMLAGHETTATTIAWAIEELMRSPQVLERATLEARSCESTEYLEAVINESLRLHPPVPFTGRVAATDYQLGEWTLPAGTMIAPYISSVNRDPKVYSDPHVFRPERFFGERPDLQVWIPFGGGVKRCLGASFSMLELTTMLQIILRRGDLEPVRAKPERPVRKSAVVVPAAGVPVRYRITEGVPA